MGWHAAKVTAGRCYVLGLIVTPLIVTRLIVRIASRRRFTRVASVALTIEIALLILFVLASGKIAGIVFAALAIGIQAATITRFDRVTVYTAL